MLYTRIIFRLFAILSLALLVVASDEDADKNTDAKNEGLVTYSPFQAIYDPKNSNDDPIVTIKFNPNAKYDPAIFEEPQIPYPEEYKWTLMKELIVNELFGMSKLNTGFLIRPAGISKLYDMVMANRGFDDDTIKSASMSDKIKWFLKELSVVKPDALLLAIYSSFFPDTNKQYLVSHVLRSIVPTIITIHDKSSLFNTEEGIKSFVKDMVNTISDKRSKEFEEFCADYLPALIRYVVDEVNGITTDSEEPDIFSVNSDIMFPYVSETNEAKSSKGNPLDIVFGKI